MAIRTARALEPGALDALPSLGWIPSASPVVELGELARHLGAVSLWVKRDDRLPALAGGTKARKLDAILADPSFRRAGRFASVGAVGSSHLAACALAAAELGLGLDAYVFLEPITQGVLENLAATARASTRFVVHGSRTELALRSPSVLRGKLDGVPVVPPGGSSPAGVAAMVRAGLELAEQVRAEELDPPDVVYCALGTGGTAAGLALGLGLGGLSSTVRAISVVEWPLSSKARLRALMAAAARYVGERAGLALDPTRAAPIELVRAELGPGYGEDSPRSRAATEILRREGVPAEPLYTGKAMAALLDDAARGRLPGRVLFWCTTHGPELPSEPHWRERLPPRLEAWLARAGSPPKGRRRVLAGLGAAGLVGSAGLRVSGYPPIHGWFGHQLSTWQAHVLAAAAEVLTGVPEVRPYDVATAVDRFVSTLPPGKRREIDALLSLVEHGTTPLGLRLSRFTELEPEAREAYLLSMASRGGLLADAARGLRDLVMLGAYRDEASWAGLGYRGPWVSHGEPGLGGDELSAPKGARPRAAERA
jgi:D-cysteine desulfhydrase